MHCNINTLLTLWWWTPAPGWQRSSEPISFTSCGLVQPQGPILGGLRPWNRRRYGAASSS